ncbi:von Willebrand factor A-like protein [Gracilaria domingensis]|nr:von Willebrand factor A-like protein [Gracilaria domingensis]
MNTFTVAFLSIAATLALVSCSANGSVQEVSTAVKLNNAEPCQVDVCFGLEGSNLTKTQFRKQKEYFQDVLTSLSERSEVRVAAVVYGAANSVLFGRTSNLTRALDKAAHLTFRGSPATSLAAPIAYCDSRLRSNSGRGSWIILFSTGESNLGGDPARRARVFRERSEGEIIVISLGDENQELLSDLSGGNSRNLFSLGDDGEQEEEDHESLVASVTRRICS